MKEKQRGTGVLSLWQKASIKKRGRVLENGEEQGLPPRQLEIIKEHLKVRGVFSRNRDVAAWESDIK
jgi:hypothetical protein